MWARVVEFMLGCWLALSPFVFRHGDQTSLWVADFTTSTVVMSLALVSYWRPMRHAHLATAAVALVMIGFGRFAPGGFAAAGEVGPGHQNHILVGLLLLMFALVPNDAARPPKAFEPEPTAGKA